MYEMDLYCNLFSLLDPWGKCGSFGFSLGVCSTDTARCSLLSGCLVSVEDEHLRKRVILGGSATVGTRANNGYEFITLLKTKVLRKVGCDYIR